MVELRPSIPHRMCVMRLTERQRAILKAVRGLQPNAYGATIGNVTGFPIPYIYSDLREMEAEHLVGSSHAAGGQERGYRSKLLWSLTVVGRAALDQEGK